MGSPTNGHRANSVRTPRAYCPSEILGIIAPYSLGHVSPPMPCLYASLPFRAMATTAPGSAGIDLRLAPGLNPGQPLEREANTGRIGH